MGRDTNMAGKERTSRINLFIDVVLPSAKLPLKASYTVAEVAKMLGVTPRTIYSYLSHGTCGLRPVRVRGTTRIFREDLERMFEDMEIADGTRAQSDI